MLKTENPKSSKKRIMAAARVVLGGGARGNGGCVVVYEHGQWWLIHRMSGAQWSVADATGPGTSDGYGFEMVTEPNE